MYHFRVSPSDRESRRYAATSSITIEMRSAELDKMSHSVAGTAHMRRSNPIEALGRLEWDVLYLIPIETQNFEGDQAMSNVKRIEEDMTEYPCIASQNMTITEAVEFMKKCGIRHLPVVEKGAVLGVVSERDLKQAEILSDAMTMLVSDVMTPKPYCVKIGTPLADVAREMAKNKYGCTVVLNQIGRVVGIFTTTDGMRVLSEILDSKPERKLRVVRVEELLTRDYGMTAPQVC
jgi:acetoin utilization protein AcuB